MWKIVGVSKVSVLYIYIYIYIDYFATVFLVSIKISSIQTDLIYQFGLVSFGVEKSSTAIEPNRTENQNI